MSLFFKVPMLADICVWIQAHVFMKIKSILTIYYLKAQLFSKYHWFRANEYSRE